jgi:prepilin-type N-terminal cleavage/methylation domain-containing protein
MEHGWRTAGSDTAAGLVNNDVNRLPRRGESGFTLVEVLVAVVVLSITGLAAAQFAIGAIRTSYAQQQRSTAIALGGDGIERMRAQIAGSKAKPSHYYQDLLHGMGADGVKQAQANLAAVGAITSQVSDLASTATPDADTSKYIQPVRTTTGKDAKQTTYTVNTVVEKCYRLSGTMDCSTASDLGITGISAISDVDGNADASLKASILDAGSIPGKGFLYQTRTYMPMVRVVVGVTWPDGMQRGKTCVYTTTELLNVIGD